MAASLGFDTLIVNNRIYDRHSLSLLFEGFSRHDIKNYIFLSDFDFTTDSLSLKSEKSKNFQNTLKSIAPRGVHTKVCFNLCFGGGVASNPQLRRIYANKKSSALFIGLPTMIDTHSYQHFALDINRLIYKINALPLCTGFDKILETSDSDICIRLLQNPKLAFGFDLNYLLSPVNSDFLKQISTIKPLLIPTISNYIEAYGDIDYFHEKALENIGKDNYYSICSKINKCASYFGF